MLYLQKLNTKMDTNEQNKNKYTRLKLGKIKTLTYKLNVQYKRVL